MYTVWRATPTASATALAFLQQLVGMKQVEKHRWRYKWAGKMIDGKLYYTAEEIKRQHPEATAILGSMKLFEEPETEAELNAILDLARRPPRNFLP